MSQNNSFPSSKAPKDIPLETIIKYRKKNLTIDEISRVLGVSHQTLHKRIAPYRDELDYIDDINTYRADLLSILGHRILKSLSIEDIKKATAYQRVGMYGILYDKLRLETGQSTSNVAYADMGSKVQDLDKQIRELEGQLSAPAEDLEDDVIDA